MANAKATNGNAVAEPTKRQTIPTRIRKHINEAFDALEDLGIRETNTTEASEKVSAKVTAAKKEVLAYMNGQCRLLHA